jgi:hypothetical protein
VLKVEQLNHFYMIFRLSIFVAFVLFLAGGALAASLMSKLDNGKKRVAVNRQGAPQNQLAHEAK